MENYLLGIDLGTSSVKAALFNLGTGKLETFHACHYSEYSEYAAATLWERTQEAIYKANEKVGRYANVAAIGISAQMHGVVLFDSTGKTIEPLINWRDEKRYNPLVLDFAQQVSDATGSNETGTRLVAGYTGAILNWIKQNEPSLLKKTDHFGLFADFVRTKLTGKNDRATDRTNAAGTGVFDIRSNRWHDTLIAKLGIPPRIFPLVYSMTEIAGTLSGSIAKSLNLKAGIPIIYGGGDNQMSMVGSGLLSSASPPLLNIGTGAQLSKVNSAFQEVSEIEIRPFLENEYALVAASLGGGGHYYKLLDDLRKTQSDINYPIMNEQAALVPAGAEGLYYCTGPSRSNPARKKGFFGKLNKMNNIGHQARAVMEGVLMDLYEMSVTNRLDIDQTLMIGAGKALQVSAVWRQIAADMFGKQLQVTKLEENAVLGAILMAGLGLKIFDAPKELAQIIEYDTPTEPNKVNTKYYQEQYRKEWNSLIDDL